MYYKTDIGGRHEVAYVGSTKVTEVRMLACMSLDGYIARRRGESQDREAADGWASSESKREFWREVRDADVILCGRAAMEEIPETGKPLALLTSNPDEPVSRIGVDPDWTVEPTFGDARAWLDGIGGKRVLVCGGSRTYDFFLRWNLVDRLVLTVEPVTFGGGVPLRTSPQTRGGMQHTKFSLLKCASLNSRGTLRLDLLRPKP